jgi:2-polyprenyl-3-methyl-5-hydroxy-6-metoxy-1,4-benzoquinol methylase
MNKEFNSKAFAKDYVVDSQERARLSVVLPMIGTNKSVLDLGCRDGTISKMIREMGNSVECVEISEYSIARCKEKGLKVYDLDLNKNWSESISQKYDVVFAGEILEHIYETDIFLSNIYKVLKPDGYVIISTPNLASLGRRVLLLFGKNPVMELTTRSSEAGHLRYYIYGSLKKVLLENKLKVVDFKSDIVNLINTGKITSTWLAQAIPSFGRSLIVKAIKND